jgi:tetratricopeptide (TPR) repeat protein
LENTVFVVVGDHGEALGDHGEETHGNFVYESTLRVPFLVCGPGVRAAQRIAEQSGTVDLFPTVLGLLGLEIPPSVQGKNLAPTLLSGSRVESAPIYFESLTNQFKHGWAALHGVSAGRYKYTFAPHPDLFDVVADPLERDNLAQREAHTRERLHRLLERIVSQRAPAELQASVVQMDDEARQRLGALGYAMGTSALAPGEQDPRDMADVIRSCEEAAQLLFSASDAVQAAGLLRGLTERHPESAWMWEHFGLASLNAQRWDDAARAYERAVAIHPGVSTLMNLAEALYWTGHKEEAVRRMEEALVLDENNRRGHHWLGDVCSELGRYTEALAHYKRVLALWRGDDRVHRLIRSAVETQVSYLEHTGKPEPVRSFPRLERLAPSGSHEARDLCAGPIQRCARVQAERMRGGGFAGAALEEGTHDGDDARIDGREAGVVQIRAGEPARAGATGSFG